MSHENVEIVRHVYELLNADGIEAVLDLLAPDTVWHPFPEWIEKSEYRGYEGVREVAAVWTENFDDFAIEVEEFRDLGNEVAALTVQTGKIKGSGDPVRQPVGVLWSDFRGGRIGEAYFFQSWQEALEPAGLRE
jgi:ketosteroid isomerase-like protein